MSGAFEDHLRHCADEVEARLADLLQRHGQAATPDRLGEAMAHAVLNGGKRLRPFLLLQSASLFDARDQAMEAACALELVHCYSLVHDDLPAMDDDDLRRGKPTVHIAFDEATAILAGDALLTLAFEVLATAPVEASVRVSLLTLLARAAGAGGMIGGQVLDIEAETQTPDEAAIRRLQAMKTGALIRFGCEAGAVIGGATDDQRAALVSYGERIGLAFQLADDLLDLTASTNAMGKRTGKDAGVNKGTLVSLHGEEKTRAMLSETVEAACDSLSGLGAQADTLRSAAQFVALRQR